MISQESINNEYKVQAAAQPGINDGQEETIACMGRHYLEFSFLMTFYDQLSFSGNILSYYLIYTHYIFY